MTTKINFEKEYEILKRENPELVSMIEQELTNAIKDDKELKNIQNILSNATYEDCVHLGKHNKEFKKALEMDNYREFLFGKIIKNFKMTDTKPKYGISSTIIMGEVFGRTTIMRFPSFVGSIIRGTTTLIKKAHDFINYAKKDDRVKFVREMVTNTIKEVKVGVPVNIIMNLNRIKNQYKEIVEPVVTAINPKTEEKLNAAKSLANSIIGKSSEVFTRINEINEEIDSKIANLTKMFESAKQRKLKLDNEALSNSTETMSDLVNHAEPSVKKAKSNSQCLNELANSKAVKGIIKSSGLLNTAIDMISDRDSVKGKVISKVIGKVANAITTEIKEEKVLAINVKKLAKSIFKKESKVKAIETVNMVKDLVENKVNDFISFYIPTNIISAIFKRDDKPLFGIKFNTILGSIAVVM